MLYKKFSNTYIMDKESRREYFRRYYKDNKDKYRQTYLKDKKKPKRGRPKKIVKPFSIIYLDTPITISFN